MNDDGDGDGDDDDDDDVEKGQGKILNFENNSRNFRRGNTRKGLRSYQKNPINFLIRE